MDDCKKTRFLSILEVSVEYFISILVTGAYLAKITSVLGLSDSLTGILTAFVSLGCGFQIIAIFLSNKRPVRRWVTMLHIINELAFALIYLMPFIDISKPIKIALFIVFLLIGFMLNNVVRSPKINWYMSFVDDNNRGDFAAKQEATSLIGGMIFSFTMGAVIDNFEASGNISGAFIVCGLSLFVLMISHSIILILSKEKPFEEKQKISTKNLLKNLMKNKDLFKVILVFVLWNIVNYAATPFYGAYQINELGFSMTFVSILAIIYSIVRASFSRPLGKFADKYSFAKMLNICFVVMLIAFTINVFTVPENGKVFYTFYYILYAIGMAGINNAMINLVYDYVDKENRTSALALNYAISGFAGFFTTLAISPLVAYIQGNGNTFLGINAYAQQVVSAISAILLIVLIIYLNFGIKKTEKC